MTWWVPYAALGVSVLSFVVVVLTYIRAGDWERSKAGETIRADFDFVAVGRSIDEVPTLPPADSVWRLLRGTVLECCNKIPIPSSFLFGQAFPRLVPQFVNRQVPSHSRTGTSAMSFDHRS